MIDYSALYSRGEIASWYLRDSQYLLYKKLKTQKRVIANCRRRFGKGTTIFTHILEEMNRKHCIWKYGAETQSQAFSIYHYLISQIFLEDPKSKPRWSNLYKCFMTDKFESQLYIFGVKDSGEIDKMRGPDASGFFCDEFGFWKFKPDYIIKSVIAPQLLKTNGQLIIASTPPPDMTHRFIDYVIDSEIKGTLFKWTIDDSLRTGEIIPAEHDQIVEDCGGIDTEDYRREWQCELIASSKRLVVPEGQDDELYVGKQERPPFYDSYVCMDLGLVDDTFVGFAYLDFKQSRLIVEKEHKTNYTTTGELCETCEDIEGNMKWRSAPHRRIGDCEMQQLFDMTKDHGYPVTPITKRSKQSGKGFRDSVLNGLRIGIKEGKVLIDPDGCPNLVKQIKYGIWNEKRTDFERTETMGHLDGIMMLAYLYDNIEWTKNPYPHRYEGLTTSTHFIKEEYINVGNRPKLGKLLGR
jgi:hypothetical protein